MYTRDNITKLTLDRLECKLETAYSNSRHMTDAANGVFMAALRSGVDINSLINDLENGTAFATEAFFAAKSGNLLDFLKSDYHSIAQSLVNITAGGNGGMASIGRGEFFIAFMSNFQAMIAKSGNGDIDYKNKCEEVKHNGGKITVAKKAGREVTRSFLELVESSGATLKGADYLPGRKKDVKMYSDAEAAILNSLYWTATTGENTTAMSYEQWALSCINRAASNVFEISDSLLVVNDNNDFVRFTTVNEVVDYYSQDVKAVDFELRSNQANPVAIYLKVFDNDLV